MNDEALKKLSPEELRALRDEAQAAYDEYVAGLGALRDKGNGILSRARQALVEEKIRQIESGKPPAI